MAYATMKPTKPGLEKSQEQIHRIRITLSSKNVKNLEKVKQSNNGVCSDEADEARVGGVLGADSQDQDHSFLQERQEPRERVCTVRGAKDKRLRAKRLVKMPNMVLHITTRKSPCGEVEPTHGTDLSSVSTSELLISSAL
ncbi:unnamed protein product [Camellia sinensis]